MNFSLHQRSEGHVNDADLGSGEDVAELAATFRVLPTRSPQALEFARAMWQRLAAGTPVDPDEYPVIARRAGVAPDQLTGLLRAGAEFGAGAIVGFCGLTLLPHPHRLVTPSATLFTWCAFDPFFLIPALGVTADFETADPVTGRPLHVRLSPEGVVAARPESAVLWIPSECTSGEFGSVEQLQSSFCSYANLFEDAASAGRGGAAGRWLTPHEAFELARLTCGGWG